MPERRVRVRPRSRSASPLRARTRKPGRGGGGEGCRGPREGDRGRADLPGATVAVGVLLDAVAGGEVLATDPTTGKTSKEKVTDTIEGRGAKKLVKVTIDTDGDKGLSTDTITATAGHPFWVPDLKKWLKAGDLKPGEWLRTGSGTGVKIEAVSAWTQQAAVYNLTVDTAHTYYVVAGTTQVLVHNCAVSPHSLERTEQLGGTFDRQLVDEIAESMSNDGWVGKPIEVFEHLNRRYIINGHHRVAAAKKAGIDVPYRSLSLDEIKAYKYRSADEVVWASVEVGPDFPEERRGRRRR
ncbi:polymorphic toxin-type HINT domain-containing protein [Streptomyces sp. NPDC093984]|uniref:polymorphic toxin-type HINT domain-containing protein n=1 Tax=Streptomyces sp. NPDC093984 TaxID=3366052 RepID=UPI0037F7C802